MKRYILLLLHIASVVIASDHLQEQQILHADSGGSGRSVDAQDDDSYDIYEREMLLEADQEIQEDILLLERLKDYQQRAGTSWLHDQRDDMVNDYFSEAKDNQAKDSQVDKEDLFPEKFKITVHNFTSYQMRLSCSILNQTVNVPAYKESLEIFSNMPGFPLTSVMFYITVVDENNNVADQSDPFMLNQLDNVLIQEYYDKNNVNCRYFKIFVHGQEVDTLTNYV
ncbi:MAG: hypothetical protein CL947_03990 [Epsilonproteobacteria bacterium]|nr:hypothetical protein [Campylobacterota bacterium]|tara:strand:+ start:5886 stop:6560 length:675 start_codon:yes stop_codon:yes gene_type:complete